MCGPEFSDLEAAIWQHFLDDEVLVLGLNSGGDNAEDLAVFVDAFQITFPILLDANSTFHEYRRPTGVSPYPLDYVIDQAGRVAYFNTEYTPEEMIEVIEQLLATPVGVSDEIPAATAAQLTVRPNPFNPRTWIAFDLPAAATVSVTVHDTRGRVVRRLITGEQRPAGHHQLLWDGNDAGGRTLPSGVYFARLDTGAKVLTRKMTLLR